MLGEIARPAPAQRFEAAAASPVQRKRPRLSPFWVRQLHSWHWMSSAICLVGMLLFAVTGITLNHAAEIEGGPRVTTVEAVLSPALLASLRGVGTSDYTGSGDEAQAQGPPVPGDLRDWASRELSVDLGAGRPEWSADELYVALPRPGGDGWVSVDRTDGNVVYERTDRGWISWANDLHKGRNTGTAWRWFIDIFAVACLVFCVTGFFLLQLHARHRRATWPMVGAGLAVPLLLIVLFMHG